MSGDGRDVDDSPVSSRSHALHHGPGHMDDAVDVDLVHVVHGRLVKIIQSASDHDAGVVDGDGNCAQLRLSLVHHGLDLRVIGHIGANRYGGASDGADLFGRCFRLSGAGGVV